MADVIYIKLDCNIDSAASVTAKIAKIDAIIDSLLNTALVSVGNGNIVEYELDTGQTRTNVTYSKTESVVETIKKYEDLRTYYNNKLIPRNVRLVDSSNFRR